jgi:hypothetical protein
MNVKVSVNSTSTVTPSPLERGQGGAVKEALEKVNYKERNER